MKYYGHEGRYLVSEDGLEQTATRRRYHPINPHWQQYFPKFKLGAKVLLSDLTIGRVTGVSVDGGEVCYYVDYRWLVNIHIVCMMCR